MDIDNINHVGIAVRQMSDAQTCFEAMGFTLTPYSPHSGSLKAGETVQNFNSGNRCLMFGDSYLEILASEDPANPAPRITKFLESHQGGQIICFNSEDLPGLSERLRQAEIPNSGVLALQRDIDTPEGVKLARFERIQFEPDNSPEGYIQAARHLTPEYIYQPRFIGHDNACHQLSQTILVVDDVDAFTSKYRALLALEPVIDGDTVNFHFPSASRLTITGLQGAKRVLPGSLLPPIPGIAGVAFRTTKLDRVRTLLKQNAIPFADQPHRLVVPAECALGISVAFEE